MAGGNIVELSLESESALPQGINQERDQLLELVKQIVLKVLANHPVDVYLFGSFARGEETLNSDIDIAIRYHQPVQPETKNQLRLALAESIPREVEIVELVASDAALLRRVQSEGIVWIEHHSVHTIQRPEGV